MTYRTLDDICMGAIVILMLLGIGCGVILWVTSFILFLITIGGGQ